MSTVTAAAPTIAFVQAGREELAAQLTGFWAADEWDLSESPLLPPGKKIRHTFIKFDLPSASLNVELKYACWRKFNGGGWSPATAPSTIAHVRAFFRFLKAKYPEAQSLLERELDEWRAAFQAYLEEEGIWAGPSRSYVDQSHNIRRYSGQDTRLSVLPEFYRLVDTRPEYEKDVWDVRRMGVTLSPSDEGHTLKFTRVTQPWLRQAAKRYVRYRLAICSLSHVNWIINALNNFSAFLEQLPRQVQPADIDRALIIEYLAYLAAAQSGKKARQSAIGQLRLFLETCAREEWAAFPDKRLIFEEDIPQPNQTLPRPIPEEVLSQLHAHLDSLPEPFRTMVIVVEECGMRISELLSISLDCLMQDQAGDWFLFYVQWKMKKDHVIPITQDLATVIQNQQRIVRERWGGQCSILFPNEKGNCFAKNVFGQALNRLALEHDIRDSTGQLFHFRAHAFRHTVATRMLRGGVQQYHVQRYLGHESPEMTMKYVQITDQDLKKAFQEYRGLAVDITGKVVVNEQANADSTDLQWFKKNIMAQALPHGFCALPTLADSCPVPNACLTCASFRTNASFLNVLKTELAAAEKLIGLAKANNWTRQAEMNERVAANLRKIIETLEANCHDSAEQKH